MLLLARLLIVLGFCVAAVGAAGFDKQIESEALPLFAGGLVALAIGAFLGKNVRKAASTEDSSPEHALAVRTRIETIRDIVVDIHQRAADMRGPELCKLIDDLLRNEYFDLTSENEEIANRLGFTDYAKIWDGVAIAERLLARVWSIAADGYLEEALESLPDARRNIERAAEAAASLAPNG